MPVRDIGTRQIPCLPIFALPGDARALCRGAELAARKEAFVGLRTRHPARGHSQDDAVAPVFDSVGQRPEIAIILPPMIVEIKEQQLRDGLVHRIDDGRVLRGAIISAAEWTSVVWGKSV